MNTSTKNHTTSKLNQLTLRLIAIILLAVLIPSVGIFFGGFLSLFLGTDTYRHLYFTLAAISLTALIFGTLGEALSFSPKHTKASDIVCGISFGLAHLLILAGLISLATS